MYTVLTRSGSVKSHSSSLAVDEDIENFSLAKQQELKKPRRTILGHDVLHRSASLHVSRFAVDVGKVRPWKKNLRKN